MGYQQIAGAFVPSGALTVSSTQIAAFYAGLQAEFEERMEAGLLNGVESGCACSIASTTISIATGVMWVEGRRFRPAPSTVAFTAGDGADTYWVYVDPTDTTSPYQKGTSDPGAGYLVLCAVEWNGSDTLSNLVDLRPWGLLPADMVIAVPGTVATGVHAVIPVTRNLWIESVQICMSDNGADSGSTIVDVHLGADGSKGDSIFTTQDNRPTLAHDTADYTVAVSGLPDGDRLPDSGEHLVVEVDAVAGTAGADLTVTIKARVRCGG